MTAVAGLPKEVLKRKAEEGNEEDENGEEEDEDAEED